MMLQNFRKILFPLSLVFSITAFSQEATELTNSSSNLENKIINEAINNRPSKKDKVIEAADASEIVEETIAKPVKDMVDGIEIVEETMDESVKDMVDGIEIVEEAVDEEVEQEPKKQEAPKNIVYKKLVEDENKVYVAPSSKFNLSQWSLSVPSDNDNNGRADQIKEKELSDGYSNKYFYIGEDGGMVFTCPIGGFKTSSNTTYTRSELREMLRAGNYKIKAKGPNANNWVLKSSNCIYDAGGYNGQLNATLAINNVTTTGKEKQVGRVIIGQIHAEHNEPLRLYYRKLPNNEKGSIYFAHEGRDDDKEKYYELIGSKSSTAKNPEDGIALGEKFSYQVLVLDNMLAVRIIKKDKTVFEKKIDIAKSGYEDKTEYMYFKAGVYNQNKSGEPDDYVQATFYKLENKHQKYVEETYDD